MNAFLLQEEKEPEGPLWKRAYEWITLFISPDQLGYMVMIAGAAVVRAMGVTVRSGETGLLFTFGRAGVELQPGFRLLIPFLQVVRLMPSRSQTLDLPAQRVVTNEGLVYQVDANLVYRVVDIHKAVIEIDDLRKGMLQILGLGVQGTLRAMTREELNKSEELQRRLAEVLEEKLTPWGVRVEQAGFTSITPSERTLRVTQFARTTNERVRVLQRIERGGVGRASALGLVGTRRRFAKRTRSHIALATRRASQRRIRAALLQRGIPGARLGAVLKLGALYSSTQKHSPIYEVAVSESKPALASK